MVQRRGTGIAELLGDLRAPEPTPAEVPAPAEPITAAPARNRSARKAPAPAKTARARAAEAEAGKGKERGAGKRSDPAYKLYGVRLRIETHLDATDRLRRRKEYPDFEELVQSLVEKWLREG